MYKPSELFQFLESLGIRPKKSLSQNFLVDGNIIRKIISAARINPGDLVIEIGSGPGSLTKALLEAKAKVVAIEKDAILAQALTRFHQEGDLAEIFQADVLSCDLEALFKKYLKEGRKGKVIANVPYHITTPIITRFVQYRDQISEIILMVQDEVARRCVGKPKTPDYSSLTLFLNYYSYPEYLFKVSRNCFYPSPKVDSAVIRFVLRTPPQVSYEERFFQVTRTAFEHRRKMLRASLKDLYPPEKVMLALQNIGKKPEARPEELSLEEFLAFFEHVK